MNPKTLTLLILNQSLSSLQLLAAMNLPVRASYRLALVINQFNDLLNPYNEQVTKLQKKYSDAETTPPGSPLVFNSDADEKSYKAEVKTLNEEPCEINLPPISIEDLGEVSIPPVNMMNLIWLFTDEV